MKYYGDIYNEVTKETLMSNEFADCKNMKTYLWYKAYQLEEAKKR